jgi:hypothetical protein
MTRATFGLIAGLMTLLFGIPCLRAETTEDRLLGKVSFRRDVSRLDGQGRREVADIAAKVRRIVKPGAVKIRGVYRASDDQGDNLANGVLMARTVEQQLKSAGAGPHQVFIVASRPDLRSKSGQNFVEVLFYPHELEEREIILLQGGGGTPEAAPTPIQQPSKSSRPGEPRSPAASPVPAVSPVPVAPGADKRALSPARTDASTRDVEGQRRGKQAPQPVEDVNMANELVRRAKAKAAERAKRAE